ncbi:N-acetylglucosamine-6-phosphate deacetylase [Nonomuraea spiralis]|nr:N-acetylglucosamine-6-phosphate deacetylase [Nonomuraea spiralis]
MTGARAVLPGEVREDLAVVVSGDRIEAVLPAAELVGVRRVDAGGAYLTPGLIDLHTHGAGGRGFDEGDAVAWTSVLAAQARFGVTAVQASLATAPPADLADRLALARTITEPDIANDPADGPPREGARLLGVHLEGPFLAPEQAGAHDPALLVPPSAEAVGALLAAGTPSMVTLAPELPGGIEAVRRFAAAGSVVAIGHSQAAGDVFAAAVAAGVTHLTHLWSGQSALTRRGPWRVPGLLEESLASDGLTAEVIADGRHLPPQLLRIAARCLPGRLCVVSDATPGAGLPDGSPYRLGALDCVVRDGVGMAPGGASFAGSTTGLGPMLGHLRRELGLGVPEVVAMATATPARVLGLRDQGALRAGCLADLALFDDDFGVRATVVGGRWLLDEDGLREGAA